MGVWEPGELLRRGGLGPAFVSRPAAWKGTVRGGRYFVSGLCGPLFNGGASMLQRSWCEPVGLRSTCGQSSCNWLWAICVGVMALTGVMSSKRNGLDCDARMKWEVEPWLAEGAPTGQRRGYPQCELPATCIIPSRGVSANADDSPCSDALI